MISEQRRLNLEANLRELETKRAILERKIAGAGTGAEPEWTHELTMLQASVSQTEREILTLVGGDARTQARDRAVLILNERMVALETAVRALEKRLDTWFEMDRQGRQSGQLWANAYRVAVIGLVAFDVAVRALK